MTAPAAYEPAKDQCGKDGKSKEYESRVDRSILERIYRFGRFDRGDGAARDAPLNDVGNHQQVQNY